MKLRFTTACIYICLGWSLMAQKVGINIPSPAFDLDIRTLSTNDGADLNLGNIDNSHFLRFFSGRELEFAYPIIYWKSGDSLSMGTNLNVYTELLKLRSDGTMHLNSEKGIRLDARDRPLITRGWDPFTSGMYAGLGRWGVFMEPAYLTFGMPDLGNRGFQFVRYATDGSIVSILMRLWEHKVGINQSTPESPLHVNNRTGTNLGAGSAVIYGRYTGTNAENVIGVRGYSRPTSEDGIGGLFEGNFIGVQGVSTRPTNGTGVGGSASGISARGVYGFTSGINAIGVMGECMSSGSTGVAGFARMGGDGVFGNVDGGGGRGVYGYAADTSVTSDSYGGYFISWGKGGRGVYGSASNASQLTNYGGYFIAQGIFGIGTLGEAANTSNSTNYGGYFRARGVQGRGVYGIADHTGGGNYGGYFEANGSSGRGVYGNATATSGIGVYGEANAASGKGVYGRSSGATGRGVEAYVSGSTGKGVYARADGSFGIAVEGYASGSMTSFGGYFRSDGSSGIAVYGTADAASSTAHHGGFFTANGTGGTGVQGYVTGLNARGVYGNATGNNGIAVEGNGQLYDFYASGTGTNYGSPSSIRWKTSMDTLKNILTVLDHIYPYRYIWDAAHGGHQDIGFIAEEIMVYFPEIAIADPDAPGYSSGMDYSRMTVVLLAAIQEQQQVINTFQEQIHQMKETIEAMQAEMAALQALSADGTDAAGKF